MMIDRAMIVGLVGSLGALLFVLELVRQRRLREEYSLLWLATAIVLIILSVSRPLLDVLASAIGIFYPPSALFVVAVIFVLFILLHFSTVITRLSQENKETAQQLALLWHELELVRRSGAARQEREDRQDDHQSSQIE